MGENQVVLKGKHIEIIYEGKTKTNLTSVFAVVNAGVRLGSISWYSQWRRYAFFASGGTVFDAECLLDIARFVQNLMDEYHKMKDSAEKLHQEAEKQHALDGAAQMSLPISEFPVAVKGKKLIHHVE